MTLHTLIDPQDPGQPPSQGTQESALSYALRAIGELLSQSPLAHEQFAEARYDQAEADRLTAEAAQAAARAADADARVAAERHKADPHKRIGRRLAVALAAALALLDLVPAYWSAQAFGLDQYSTIMVTILLCTAAGGTMWLLDLFTAKGHTTALRALQAVLGAGFTALFVLRLNYLQVAAGEPLLPAAIQSLALTALSAVLIAVGYVLLSHRLPKPVADATRQARQAASTHASHTAATARTTAARSKAALEDTIIAHTLTHPPATTSHDQLLQAINQATTTLLTRQTPQLDPPAPQ